MLLNWCWRRLLRVPWTARRSNQSILKEINPEYSLEGLMLKLKLQYFGHVMQRTDSMEKNLILERLKVGGEGDDRGWDGWMASATQWTWVWVSSGSWWWTGKPGVLQSRGSKRVGHGWAAELNWAPSLPVIIWSVIMDQDHKEFFLYGNLMWRHMVYLGETDNLEPPRSLSAFLIRVNSFHCGVWGNLMHPMFTVHSSIIYSCQDMESP